MVALSEILAHVTGVPHTLDGPYLVSSEPGGEPYISRWDEVTLGVRPTEAQMAAAGMELAIEQAILAATTSCDAALAPLSTRYCPYERDTWTEQVKQSQALLADPSLETPPVGDALDPVSLLRSITAQSGESMASLAMAILKNREKWLVVSGVAIGQRQAIENKIKACETPEEVEAVDITISLPG